VKLISNITENVNKVIGTVLSVEEGTTYRFWLKESKFPALAPKECVTRDVYGNFVLRTPV
jgi:hypothetical protein